MKTPETRQAKRIKREALEHWKKFPSLVDLYDTPEEYAEALMKINARLEEENRCGPGRALNNG
jgi:hypothetical protein